jgi:hypothetical protein
MRVLCVGKGRDGTHGIARPLRRLSAYPNEPEVAERRPHSFRPHTVNVGHFSYYLLVSWVGQEMT